MDFVPNLDLIAAQADVTRGTARGGVSVRQLHEMMEAAVPMAPEPVVAVAAAAAAAAIETRAKPRVPTMKKIVAVRSKSAAEGGDDKGSAQGAVLVRRSASVASSGAGMRRASTDKGTGGPGKSIDGTVKRAELDTDAEVSRAQASSLSKKGAKGKSGSLKPVPEQGAAAASATVPPLALAAPPADPPLVAVARASARVSARNNASKAAALPFGTGAQGGGFQNSFPMPFVVGPNGVPTPILMHGSGAVPGCGGGASAGFVGVPVFIPMPQALPHGAGSRVPQQKLAKLGAPSPLPPRNEGAKAQQQQAAALVLASSPAAGGPVSAAAAPSSSLDALAFERKARPVVAFKPYTLRDMAAAREALGLGIVDPATGTVQYQQLGVLGADLGSEALVAKRAAKERARAFAEAARIRSLAQERSRALRARERQWADEGAAAGGGTFDGAEGGMDEHAMGVDSARVPPPLALAPSASPRAAAAGAASGRSPRSDLHASGVLTRAPRSYSQSHLDAAAASPPPSPSRTGVAGDNGCSYAAAAHSANLSFRDRAASSSSSVGTDSSSGGLPSAAARRQQVLRLASEGRLPQQQQQLPRQHHVLAAPGSSPPPQQQPLLPTPQACLLPTPVAVWGRLGWARLDSMGSGAAAGAGGVSPGDSTGFVFPAAAGAETALPRGGGSRLIDAAAERRAAAHVAKVAAAQAARQRALEFARSVPQPVPRLKSLGAGGLRAAERDSLRAADAAIAALGGDGGGDGLLRGGLLDPLELHRLAQLAGSGPGAVDLAAFSRQRQRSSPERLRAATSASFSALAPVGLRPGSLPPSPAPYPGGMNHSYFVEAEAEGGVIGPSPIQLPPHMLQQQEHAAMRLPPGTIRPIGSSPPATAGGSGIRRDTRGRSSAGVSSGGGKRASTASSSPRSQRQRSSSPKVAQAAPPPYDGGGGGPQLGSVDPGSLVQARLGASVPFGHPFFRPPQPRTADGHGAAAAAAGEHSGGYATADGGGGGEYGDDEFSPPSPRTAVMAATAGAEAGDMHPGFKGAAPAPLRSGSGYGGGASSLSRVFRGGLASPLLAHARSFAGVPATAQAAGEPILRAVGKPSSSASSGAAAGRGRWGSEEPAPPPQEPAFSLAALGDMSAQHTAMRASADAIRRDVF